MKDENFSSEEGGGGGEWPYTQVIFGNKIPVETHALHHEKWLMQS